MRSIIAELNIMHFGDYKSRIKAEEFFLPNCPISSQFFWLRQHKVGREEKSLILYDAEVQRDCSTGRGVITQSLQEPNWSGVLMERLICPHLAQIDCHHAVR